MATDDILTLSKEEVQAMTQSEFTQAISESAKLAVDNTDLEQKKALQERDAELLEQIQAAEISNQELFNANDLVAYEVALKELNELKDTHRVVQERLNVYLADGVILHEVDYDIVNQLIDLVKVYHQPMISEKESQIREKIIELNALYNELYGINSLKASLTRSINTIAHLSTPHKHLVNYPSSLVELNNLWKR